jgi:predicted N-acyltransferase
MQASYTGAGDVWSLYCGVASSASRKTVQYRWTNRDKALDKKFESFDEYLETFKAKRRKEVCS